LFSVDRNCIHFWLDRRTKFIVNEIKRKKTVSPICRYPSNICEHKKMQPNQTKPQLAKKERERMRKIEEYLKVIENRKKGGLNQSEKCN
jgi:hypothetical protein